jgi:transcriptional regulator with XRE-family HTH domain
MSKGQARFKTCLSMFAYGGRINRVADSDRTTKSPISGAQLRAARALLKWSVRDLSAQCRVSPSAITRGEKVDGAPPMQVRNLDAIRRAFEEHWIEFLGIDGVRLLPGHRRIERRMG